MHTAPILFAALAAFAPTDESPPDFTEEIFRAEVTGTDDEVQIIAYDDAGQVIGTISLWLEADGQVHLASDYIDGYAETVVVDGRARTEATLPPEVIARRADAMLFILDYDVPGAGPQESAAAWFECGAYVLVATGTCVGGATAVGPLIACPGVAGIATCKCITAIAEEVGGRPCGKG